MRKLATSLTWVAALSAVACSDALDVPNKDNPDVLRALGTPALIEQVISTTYQQIHTGLYGSSDAISPQAMVMSFESYGNVANFGMQVRAALPRGQVSNERNNVAAAGNVRDFSHMSRRARDAANGLRALDTLLAHDGTLGNAGSDNTGINRRARAFAFFSNGVALGNLALTYDSAAIVTQRTGPTEIPELSGYKDVMAAAFEQLDSAYAIASAPASASGFPLPDAWIRTPVSVTQARFLQLIRSHKARFRANVARTPTDRAAVDWAAVIADATNGITSDFVISIQTGWPLSFQGGQMYATNSSGWHQMSPMIYGMADTSGGYNAWIGTEINSRSRFLVKTPDKRWPAGETRAIQQANSPANAAWDYSKFPYIRNRSNADTDGEPWGNSYYDFYRFKSIHQNNTTGPWIAMGKAEIDMLAAEGHLRLNDIAAAVPLINTWRTRAGLPALLTTMSATDPVPGGAACVPRVPVAPYNTTACGTVFEAMKYEKRMETALTGYAPWFFDARGWGDLPEATALEWPVPYQEMDARRKPFYGMGGTGGQSAATKGTYGF
jgi:hypothetical protein